MLDLEGLLKGEAMLIDANYSSHTDLDSQH